MKTQVKFAVGAGVIVTTLSGLALLGFRESKVYYHTIAELASLSGAQARQRMRVAGDVLPGSIRRLAGRVDFVLQAEGRTLEVSYVGSEPLPDTFIDGSQALVEGRWMPNGRFAAEKVQAKCASKYEPAPAQPRPGAESSPQPSKKT